MACSRFVTRDKTLADVLEERGYLLTPEERSKRQSVVVPGIHGWFCGTPDVELCRCGNIADRMCDYPMGSNRTCDIAMCSKCGLSIADGIDLCSIHAIEHKERMKNG